MLGSSCYNTGEVNANRVVELENVLNNVESFLLRAEESDTAEVRQAYTVVALDQIRIAREG